MYRYAKAIGEHSRMMKILYYLLVIKANVYAFREWNQLYVKFRWWNPITILFAAVVFLCAVSIGIYKAIVDYFKVAYEANKDDNHKGIFIKYLKDSEL